MHTGTLTLCAIIKFLTDVSQLGRGSIHHGGDSARKEVINAERYRLILLSLYSIGGFMDIGLNYKLVLRNI